MSSKSLAIGCLLILASCKGKDIRTPDAEMLQLFNVGSPGQVQGKIDSLKRAGYVREIGMYQCPEAKEFMKGTQMISDASEYACLRLEKEKSLFYFISILSNSRGPCVSFLYLVNSKGFLLKWKDLGERCAEMPIPGP